MFCGLNPREKSNATAELRRAPRKTRRRCSTTLFLSAFSSALSAPPRSHLITPTYSPVSHPPPSALYNPTRSEDTA